MKYCIIAGSGKSSRTNVEALLDDYFYLAKKDLVTVLPVTTAVSEGQVFAAQYAKDNEVPIVIVSSPSAKLVGTPAATLKEADDPFAGFFADFDPKVDSADVLILWDDDDPVCTEALAWAKKYSLKTMDLTNGMLAIQPSDSLEITPPVVIPKVEVVTTEEELEEDGDEFEDDSDETDELYEALATIVRFVVPLFLEEMEKYRK